MPASVPVCAICSDPLDMELAAAAGLSRSAAPLCDVCMEERPAFVRAVAGGSYDDLRAAIHLIKYQGVPALAEPLSRLLADAILSLRADAPDRMTVVPVPLFRGKRAFNQSDLLARSALRRVRAVEPGWELDLQVGTLRRTRWTESQFLLSREQRQGNLRGAFAVSGDLEGRHVLLIDDVYTTGATAAECTRVLLQAGATSVRVATLARAVRDAAIAWQPHTAREGPG